MQAFIWNLLSVNDTDFILVVVPLVVTLDS